MSDSLKSKPKSNRVAAVAAAIIELESPKARARSITKRLSKAAVSLEAAAVAVSKVKKPQADKWPWPTTATVTRAAAEADIEAFTAPVSNPAISTNARAAVGATKSPQVVYMVAIGTMYAPENDGRYTERIGVNLMFANYPDSVAISGACASDPTFSNHPSFKTAMINILQGLRIWGIPQIPDADKQRSGYAIHAASVVWLAHVNMHETSELSHCLGNLTIYRKTLN